MFKLSDSYGKIILVIGATSHQGGAVAEALLRTDFSMRAMVRNLGSDEAQALNKRGVEMVLGDLDDMIVSYIR